ncbi:MAG: efflux RND transporter permease subunit, partial [Bryobacteraceae bacterium]
MDSHEQPNTTEESRAKDSLGSAIARFSIRHPVTTCMVFTSFVVFGLISLARIPLVLTPDINFPFISVNVPYPNATPGQIQETIAKPIEEAVSTIPHVQRLTSRSSESSAWIGLGFDWGADIDWLRAEVREKVEQIRDELPSDLDQILVQNWSTNDQPILEGRISSRRNLRSSYDFLDAKIKKPLENVPGVAEIEIYGAVRKEVDIYLRLDDIKKHRVDVGGLFRRLDNANLNLSLGRVIDGNLRYGAISRGAMTSLDDIRNFPVNDRGIRLEDIADIYFDLPVTNSGRHLNGEYAIGFSVRKASDANTVDTVNGVMEKIEEMNRDPGLEGIDVLVWFNAGSEITKSLAGLLEAGTVGALLAVVILFLFLRKLGATLAIGFAIPFSIIATVGFLYLLGKTLNVLSMMGLMLACGMLVDNAVVVLESIFQNLEKGKDKVTAAIVGTQEVVTAVIAATLTSIIIFVPLVFGKKTNYSIWLSDTGTSIMIALLCSLFISLTLIPLGVARLFSIDVNRKGRLQQWLESSLASKLPRLRRSRSEGRKSVTDRYVSSMAWCLRHRFLVGGVLVPGICFLSFTYLKKVPDNSPEAQELQDLTIQYDFSENFHYVKIEEDYVTPIEKFLLSNRDRFKIKDVYSNYENNWAMTRVYFDKERITLEELKGIRTDLTKELPVIAGAEIKLGRQEGAESQAWLGVNLFGEDSSTLQLLAREAKNRLRRYPGFTEIHTDLDRGREEVQIRL